MSVEAMNWAMYEAPVASPIDRLVLLVFADKAHHDGTDTWPSVSKVADITGYDRATVTRSIARLRKAGLLIHTGDRPKPAGKAGFVKPVRIYKLPVPQAQSAPGKASSPRRTVHTSQAQSAPGSQTQSAPRSRRTARHNPSVDPSSVPSVDPPTERSNAPEPTDAERMGGWIVDNLTGGDGNGVPLAGVLSVLNANPEVNRDGVERAVHEANAAMHDPEWRTSSPLRTFALKLVQQVGRTNGRARVDDEERARIQARFNARIERQPA